MSTKNNKEEGFGFGLFVGALLGISGYYFFNTPQGKKLHKQLKKEFEIAKKDIPTLISQKIDNSTSSPTISRDSPLQKLASMLSPSPKKADKKAVKVTKKRTFSQSKVD